MREGAGENSLAEQASGRWMGLQLILDTLAATPGIRVQLLEDPMRTARTARIRIPAAHGFTFRRSEG